MTFDPHFTCLPGDPFWRGFQEPLPTGVRIAGVRQGRGPAVLLLHGWPGFWYDWRKVIPRLSADFDVIAPDFRGFGGSDRPSGDVSARYGAEVSARDMVALLDRLSIARVILVGHDIGATVAQTIAREYPDRVAGLVLLNPPYPGIGERRREPRAQKEFWYQHLHDLPLAEELVGRDRRSVAAYLRHFYAHWSGKPDALTTEEFEAIVGVFAKPGAFAGSIAYYRARSAAKQAAATGGSIIQAPTRVLWGDADPVIPAGWADRLDEYFADVVLRFLPNVGHFVPFEAPKAVVDAIRSLADSLGMGLGHEAGLCEPF